MAQLWTRDGAGTWVITVLEGLRFKLEENASRPVCRPRGGGTGGLATDAVLLLRDPDLEQDSWLLVAGPDAAVLVNGQPLLVGTRVLREMDEIRLRGGERRFFSKERLAAVELLGKSSSTSRCGRCRTIIDEGTPVVRCPQCRVVHHQSEELQLPCWTGYADEPFATCSVCDQPASLDGDYRWTPEHL